MLRYALYARKSDKDSDELIKSIEDQKFYCLREAERQGLAVARTYEENLTARIPGIRPVYNQMVRDIRSGRADAILTYHVNRLARNVEEGGALAQMLVEGRLREIRTPSAVYRPGDNILPLLIEQASSAQFSIDLSRRIRDAAERTAVAGGWPHQAPIGYLTERHPLLPKKTVVVPDPERFPLVRRLFEFFLSGQYSATDLAEIASEEWGLTLRRTANRASRPIGHSTVYFILNNPFYAGFVTHNGVRHVGRHQPVLTASEFRRVQEILGSRAVVRRRESPCAYNGLVRCGYCGQQVVGEGHVKAGRELVYYHCADTYRRCTKRGIREEKLEAAALGALLSVGIDRQVGDIALDALLRHATHAEAFAGEIGVQRRRTLLEVDARRERLLDLMLSGPADDQELYRKKQADLLAEHNRLLEAGTEESDRSEHMKKAAGEAVSFLITAKGRFPSASGSLKVAIFRTLATYTLYGNDLSIEIDPLLEAMSNFARRFSAPLEPAIIGSNSLDTTRFSGSFGFGGRNAALLEPPDALISLLSGGGFTSPLHEE
jgi:site-specific DNA recombinase